MGRCHCEEPQATKQSLFREDCFAKSILPAPVLQAQVRLSKGARNDLISQLFRPSVRTLVVHQAGSGLPTNLIGLVDDR